MTINTYQVSNGANRANFSKATVKELQMLGLIQFRGSSVIRNGVRVHHYTAAFDNRKPVGMKP